MGSSSEGTVRCLNADFTKEKYGGGEENLNAFDDFQRFVATIKPL